MEGKTYTVYRIVTPSGKQYVGYTSMTLAERWRHHKRRAFDGECPNHPFYNEIRTGNLEEFVLITLHKVSSRQEAMRLEEQEIANTPKELSVNLSSGGVNDAAEGGRIFWERLEANPEEKAAFLKKLSDRKLSDDWTDYDALMDANDEWRRSHPKEAYKNAYRAIRIANKATGRPAPSARIEDPRPLKERLMHKFKLNEVKSECVTKVWENRSEQERKQISDKISLSAKKRMSEMSDEERKILTQKARDSIDRGKQGKAASKGLKGWWADLKSDPIRYAEYMERRTNSLKQTLLQGKGTAV